MALAVKETPRPLDPDCVTGRAALSWNHVATETRLPVRSQPPPAAVRIL